ncbi:MAG TPA: hypothetical protein VEL75_07170 [Candidatus Methylomirabilis sp.]|nr:hypothetical protein [Candidatus Methylomirabilis sp.]
MGMLGRSFGLAESIVVVLIVASLAAGVAPLYRGYAMNARSAEAKVVASSLWAAVEANALSACGQSTAISGAYARAGLDSTGSTIPPRWSVSAGGDRRVGIDCATGAITPGGDLFTLRGVSEDNRNIRVTLRHTQSEVPPSRYRCSRDAGVSFTDC